MRQSRNPRKVQTEWKVETDSGQTIGNKEDKRRWNFECCISKYTYPEETINFTGMILLEEGRQRKCRESAAKGERENGEKE